MIKSMKAIKPSNLVTVLECAVGVENILLKVQRLINHDYPLQWIVF